MDRSWFFSAILLVLVVSGTCDASGLRRLTLRKLSANEETSADQQIPSIPRRGIEQNETAMSEVKLDSGSNNRNDTSDEKLSAESSGSKKNETHNDDSGAPLPANDKNAISVNENGTKSNDFAAENSANSSGIGDKEVPISKETIMDNRESCNRSLSICQSQGVLACIETLSDNVSKKVLLVVYNQGESSLKVNVSLPDRITVELMELEIPAGEATKTDISSTIANNKTIVLISRDSECVLHLSSPYSASSLVKQLSLHYMQSTPIFAVYAIGALVLVLGGILAFWMIRRRKKQNETPYQELEMGLPVSSDVNAVEGWDNEWDNDDWNESNAVRSPAARSRGQIRSSAKEGWESGWED